MATPSALCAHKKRMSDCKQCSEVPCKSCGKAVGNSDDFCRSCGHPAPERCTACGSRGGLTSGDKFCGACGAPPPPPYVKASSGGVASAPPLNPSFQREASNTVPTAVPLAMAGAAVTVNSMGDDRAASLRGGQGADTLIVHEARYGWAKSMWDPNTRLGSGGNHAGGAKDVTKEVRMLIANNELHVNPGKKAQYMNKTFWPETARGPAIARKLAVRFSYGVDGPVQQCQTVAVPNETACLHVTRAGVTGDIDRSAPGGNGGGNDRAAQYRVPAAQGEFLNKIPAENFEGCWGCICFPAFCALERKRAEGPDALVHEGVCFPCFSCYSEGWDRIEGTNSFKKRGADDTLYYGSAEGCLCFGPGCTVRLAKCNMIEKGRDPKAKILASEIQGCWMCMTSRATFSAWEYKKAVGEDSLIHQGICCPCMVCYNDFWDREGDSNVFVKRGKGDRLEYTSPSGPMCGKEFCTVRMCKC
uniref:DZANK-type domain-containing protein n=1 Tax=Hemiselmis andersenii TaxID=464988 RepID=A0A6U4PSD1_HEMAN|mmetsp:Transcript_20772/g.47969  ORF Transcript_20772/g.47969 Transcript_20772/m.47969 type:complete len:473 (+) Transcript_20772:83-1501(+)|eukprot:CAMPEP_0114126028 /NCGR_PEP_ID=MMETSP0043_2-20121206/9611_1 /TAXON_ID=464988 /ORGANISM="Hemiselmis andersenii, Strain CCMP644" /LENGTH=472 /DNA_ID=CAMNT_0001218985 /DNA_START=93 /DNA_END=1511 /DNA_ORIENTATION=+